MPKFKEATEKGEIVNKDGYHQPQNAGFKQKCGCELTTEKGAYRDISVKMDNGMIVHFYHQTPIVCEHNGKIWLNNGGYQTSTTKERINRYCPFQVYQEDFEWYVKYQGEILEFQNGMVLEA